MKAGNNILSFPGTNMIATQYVSLGTIKASQVVVLNEVM